MAENPLCVKSFYDKKTKSVGEFQVLQKLNALPDNSGSRNI